MQQKISFLFIDEIGISLDPNQTYFGIGGLKIQNSIDVNRKLHDVFTGALSFLNQKEERFEFKFTYITHRSLKFYKTIIDIFNHNNNWEFQYVLKKKSIKWGKTTFWNRYLNSIDLLAQKFSKEKLILISDYLSKPKKETNDLFQLIKNNSNILNILQLESQGSLLLQATDILLGGITYQKRVKNGFKPDALKLEISELISKLLIKKE